MIKDGNIKHDVILKVAILMMGVFKRIFSCCCCFSYLLLSYHLKHSSLSSSSLLKIRITPIISSHRKCMYRKKIFSFYYNLSSVQMKSLP